MRINLLSELVGYRYGFNGMERDDEVKGQGNSYDYTKRFYDSRLGRFLSIDPITQDFPYYSPYQFAGCKPIIAIDLDGLEEFVVITGIPGMVNGTAFIRVDKAFYIKEADKQRKAAISQLDTDYSAWVYAANKKDVKAANIRYAEAKASINLNHQKKLNKIDSDFKKIKYVEYDNLHCNLEGSGQLYYIIVKQGDLKDQMDQRELEMFEGGGDLIDKITNKGNWKEFITRELNVGTTDETKMLSIAFIYKLDLSFQTNFGTNNFEISDADAQELDKIADFLNAFTEIKLEIIGHTDMVGDEDSNLSLSEMRANSAKDYLISKDVSPSRLSSKGMGEKFANQNKNASDLKKAEDRRLEIKISN